MSRVTILRREKTVLFPEPHQAVEVVEVTYVSEAYGVRSVTLPLDLYRPATDEELTANPRYPMLPADSQAEEAERKAIAQALEREAVSPPASFDVP